jgi:hypothetical protein
VRRAELLLWVWLALGCARVAPPTGGPVDQTAPTVVGQYPSADATSVALDAAVEILFSEEMDRDRVAEAVFIAPETPWEPRWQGRRLRLDLSLQAGRTYVVTVGTGARDRRGNRLAQSHTLAFATGPELNRGTLVGKVYRQHQPAAGAEVWAYELSGFTGTVGTDPPAYRTQTGQDGSYAFSRLARGRYRVLALIDENRNRRHDPAEWLALPANDPTVEEGDTVRAGDLSLDRRSPPGPKLQRVQAPDARRLLLQFSGPVDPGSLAVELDGLPVEAVYASPQDSARLYLRTGPQEDGRVYTFTRLELAGAAMPWREPVHGSGRADQTPPRLVDAPPDRGVLVAGDTLWLAFSEAMYPEVPADFWIATDSTAAPPAGTWAWAGPTRLGFVPTVLSPGRHRLTGRGPALRDLAGLSLTDSLVTVTAEILDPADLGRLAGRIVGDQEGAAVVCAEGRNRQVCAPALDRAFTLGPLPPGEYVVHAFVDRDRDGVRSPGRPVPFAPSEPYGRATGAVTVPRGGVAAEVEVGCR